MIRCLHFYRFRRLAPAIGVRPVSETAVYAAPAVTQSEYRSHTGQRRCEQHGPVRRVGIVSCMRRSLMCRSGSRFHGVGTSAGIIGLGLPVRCLLFCFLTSWLCVDRPGLFRKDPIFKQGRPRGLSRLVTGSTGCKAVILIPLCSVPIHQSPICGCFRRTFSIPF